MHLPEMEERATDNELAGLMSRLDRVGHYLTPKAVVRIHAILTDCVPDDRSEGSQTQLAAFLRDRITRDDQ